MKENEVEAIAERVVELLEARPVEYWENRFFYYRCTGCKHKVFAMKNFCSCCGAEMRAGEIYDKIGY